MLDLLLSPLQNLCLHPQMDEEIPSRRHCQDFLSYSCFYSLEAVLVLQLNIQSYLGYLLNISNEYDLFWYPKTHIYLELSLFNHCTV